MNKVYFAHNIATYGTDEEAEVLKFLHKAFPYSSIINPALNQPTPSYKPNKQIKEYIKKNPCWRTPMKKDCDIGYFYDWISGCNVFAVWNKLDKCGFKCEMKFAKSINIPVFKIPAYVTKIPILKFG